MSKDTQPKPFLSNPKRAIGIVLEIIGMITIFGPLIWALMNEASFSEHVPEFLVLEICGLFLGLTGHYLEEGGWG